MPGPTSRPFAKAFVCAGGAFLAAIAALYGALGPPSSEGAGEALGRLAMTAAFPALITGLLARRAAEAWTWLKFLLVYGLCLVAVLVILTFGQASYRRP